MSTGPSEKVFSDWLAKTYNIPHKSSFSNSSPDSQDPDYVSKSAIQPLSLESSTPPTHDMANLQSQFGYSPEQKDTETISLEELVKGPDEFCTRYDKESQSARHVILEVDTVLHKDMKEGRASKKEANIEDTTEHILSSSCLDAIQTIHTFGRSQVDSPLAQSTLKNALDTAQLYINPSEVEMDKTEHWTTAISEDCDKTEPWTTATQDSSSLETTQLWTGETTIKDEDTEWLKQTSSKDVGAMQSILELEKTQLWVAPKEDKTDMISVIPKSTKRLTSKMTDFKKIPLLLEVIRCKRCQVELSTKEALKMHTCYSIMDRVIQSDGGKRRRYSSTGESKAGVGASPKPVSQSVKRTKPKKKINSIIAQMDNKQPYVLTQDMIEERIRADSVNEEKTKAIRPMLQRNLYKQLFIYNPPILHKIEDIGKANVKDNGSIASYKSQGTASPKNVKHTTQINGSPKIKDLGKGNVKENGSMVSSKSQGSVSPKTSVNTSSPSRNMKSATQVKGSPNNEAFTGSTKDAVIIENIMKTKNIPTVYLPNQRLSQLKRTAKSQHLIFKTRYYRKSSKEAEENVDRKTLPILKNEGTKEKVLKHDKVEDKIDKNIRKEEADKRSELNIVKRKFKEEVKEEGREIENIKKKDSFKKGSTDVPKPVKIGNQFQTYNPEVKTQDEPLRKRHKSDKTPSSNKEKNERKVKSEEKPSSKDSNKPSQSDLEPSSIKFKIPKYKGEKPPKQVVGFATGKFLQNENIKTLMVGESGSSLLNSLLKNSTTKTPDDASSNSHDDFMEMFDRIDSKQNKMARNNKFEAQEAQERSDIMDEGWDQMKATKSDMDRKRFAQSQFGNAISNNPNNNLTYYGFKARIRNANNFSYSDTSDFWDNRKNMPKFYLTNGETKPLAGYTFKQRPNNAHDVLSTEKMNVKVKISDFVNLMKTVLYNKKCKKMKKGNETKSMEEFETYLAHYKGGLEETINFLKFYQNHGEVDLEDWQTLEIMDLENQFSTYSGYYGATDDLKCHTCNRKHKFAL